MAVNLDSWRFIMRFGVIFSGILLVLMFFFLDESLFYREILEEAPNHIPTPDAASSNEEKVTPEVVPVEIASFTEKSKPTGSRLALWHTFPVSWSTVGKKVLAGVTSCTYPAVLWVCRIGLNTSFLE
jgi:hypothetical protein